MGLFRRRLPGDRAFDAYREQFRQLNDAIPVIKQHVDAACASVEEAEAYFEEEQNEFNGAFVAAQKIIGDEYFVEVLNCCENEEQYVQTTDEHEALQQLQHEQARIWEQLGEDITLDIYEREARLSHMRVRRAQLPALTHSHRQPGFMSMATLSIEESHQAAYLILDKTADDDKNTRRHGKDLAKSYINQHRKILQATRKKSTRLTTYGSLLFGDSREQTLRTMTEQLRTVYSRLTLAQETLEHRILSYQQSQRDIQALNTVDAVGEETQRFLHRINGFEE